MNQKDYIRFKNKFLQHLDRDSRRHVNCVRFGKGETREHVLAKFNLAFAFRAFDFLTEVYSANRKYRADFLYFNSHVDIPVVVEIPINESEESIEKKRKFWTDEGFMFETYDGESNLINIDELDV